MKNRLCSDWFRELSEKEKSDLEYILRNNTILVSSLLKILTRYENEENRSEISASQYDNPSWAYKQADTNGAKRAYAKIRALFNMETSH